MQLTVIIVNYNVKHFLEQCLYSLQQSIAHINAQVIVVDNNSTDSSISYLQPLFPDVTFIANKHNTGFAKANNQALQQATGKYVLYLNPDTLLPEDAITRALTFMENKQDAGALGIRMIDGAGEFLPESKRAFPSPFTSMFKLFGLTALFPKSKIFGRYYLGHLPADRNCEADVLAGAFMLVRKEILDITGGFDESFFMYGEDIDLSYRIQKAGWKNYYFAESNIIHFKGESTKKGSLNYVRMFYQAMYIFVQKHYSSGKAGFFKVFIKMAIGLRACLSAIANFITWIGLPAIDLMLTLLSIIGVALFWEQVVKAGIVYPAEVVWVVVPLFSILLIITSSIAGLYDKCYQHRKAIVALALAVIVNLAVYSLFSEKYRFSRGVILFGGVLASASIIGLRMLLLNWRLLVMADEKTELHRTLVCGSESVYQEVITLMRAAGRNERILGRVGLHKNENNVIGSFAELDSLLHTIPAREIVFCIDENLPLSAAMDFMRTRKSSIRYKFHYKTSHSIIGSDSKETSGEALSANEHYSIEEPKNKRWKKILDISCSVFLLVTFPIHTLLVKQPANFFKNCLDVLSGKKTWVGYCQNNTTLPPLPPAVIGSNGLDVNTHRQEQSGQALADYCYAKDYELTTDIKLLIRAYRILGS